MADGLRRAAAYALVGGVLGGLLGGAVIAVFTRRRWLLLGPAAGLAVTFAAVALVGAGVSRFDYGALREPTFYAHGEELPRLLEFSERVLAAGEGYDDSYGDAVEGLTRLIAVAGERAEEPAPIDRAIVVASDLHSNSLVLPALEGFTGGKPVFLVGDLTQRGTRYETGIVPGIARLGSPVVAVSGNHDSRPLMLAAARRGVDRAHAQRPAPRGRHDGRRARSSRSPASRVAGWDDPAESAAGTFEGHLLELKEQALLDAGAAVPRLVRGAARAARRRPRPPALARARAPARRCWPRRAASRCSSSPVTTTDQHVESEGAHVLVDGGSVGAGGAFGVGEEPSGFALVHLDADDRARPSTWSRSSPSPGSASAHRVVLEPPRLVEGEAGGRVLVAAPSAGGREAGAEVGVAGSWQTSHGLPCTRGGSDSALARRGARAQGRAPGRRARSRAARTSWSSSTSTARGRRRSST